MKQIFRIFIYLNIYTAFFSVFTAQTLRLTTKSNDSTSQHLIDSINHVKKFKDFKSLQEETRHILQILQKIGCLESELETVEKYNDSAYIANYYVGPKYTRIKIFYSNEDFIKKELLRYSNEISESYFILPFKDLEYTLNNLNIEKTKNGNTFARVNLKNIKPFDSKTLTANINVSNGSKRTIDQILIKGYNQFPESFIKYHAGIKKGMTLDNSVLIRQNNELNSLGFVSTTKPPEILFKEDSTTVYFYLKKLKNNNLDLIKDYPPIRVWGTVGFIVAMWITNLTGNKSSENQFYLAGIVAIALGIYAFTLPKCKPEKTASKNQSIFDTFGLNAFKLFANYKMALFFIFSMFLGGALQLTNMYGDVYLDSFKEIPQYADSFVVKYSTIVMSISQVSETLFILAIPFFLKKKTEGVLPITDERMSRFWITL